MKEFVRKNKKILVTGGTGYVGQHLVEALLKDGCEVFVLTRKMTPTPPNNKNLHFIIGDITRPLSLPEGVEVIYHCAGVTNETNNLHGVNVKGTQNVVDAALKNNCKLIYLSSAGVIGKTKDNILNEKTFCSPENEYERSKYLGEQIVQAEIKNDLKAQILRPTTIFGKKESPQADSFFQLIRAMRDGRYRNIGNGIYNIVHIDEVIRALMLLGKREDLFGNIYIVNNPIPYKKVDALVKGATPQITRGARSIPYPLAFIITFVLTLLFSVVRKNNPLTFSRLKALTNKKVYSQEKITNTLSFKNTLSIEEYIRQTCREYIDLNLLT